MQYVTIKIPMVLAKKIRNVMYDAGFTSVTGFVVYAARELLREIENKVDTIIRKCRWDEHNFKAKLECNICNYSPQTKVDR